MHCAEKDDEFMVQLMRNYERIKQETAELPVLIKRGVKQDDLLSPLY
jgi:hypothetical protein